MKRRLKLVLGPLIIMITLILFVWYLSNNPQVIDRLENTSLWAVAILAILYGGILASLMVILIASLMLYQKTMDTQENFLLNAYSSLVNFFGPGQSGPGFRGVYLKVKHGVKFKQYMFATLIYYAFFAIYSGFLLFSASQPWWLTTIALTGIIGVCAAVLRYFMSRNTNLVGQGLPKPLFVKSMVLLALATLVQTVIVSAIYYVELKSLDSSITLSQALAYTGAANFALFVAVTPGAIGIREAFLVFSQQLHHIPNDIIVAANVLDRAVYILFLGILFLLVLAMHAGNKLQIKKVQAVSRQADPQ